jgi:hypothetical protein
MNSKTKKILLGVLVVLILSAVLTYDYKRWDYYVHRDYVKDSRIYTCWCVGYNISNPDCPYHCTYMLPYEDWKRFNDKSYWTDLTKRLRVVAVSAYGEPADINQSFEDYLKWIEEHEKSRDTPILLTLDDMWAMAQSKSTYKEEVNGTTYYYIRLTREQMEYIKTHPEDFNVSWYYATLPLEEPKITSVTNTTEDDLVYNVDGGVGIELSYPFYRGKYVGNNAQIDRESDEEFTGEVEEEPPTIVWSNSTGTNLEDYLEFVKQYWGCCEPMVLPYPSSEDQIKNMYQVMTYFNPWWVSQ